MDESTIDTSSQAKGTSPAPHAVVASELCASYGRGDLRVPVFEHASFHIRAGSFTAITGRSGSGKTTLLSLLGGLDGPESGSLNVAGQDLATLTTRRLATYRREHVGFVFQSFNLLASLTAVENVAAGLEPLRMSYRDMMDRSQAALEAVGLGDKPHRFPHQLSGGEQQRVAVARAFAKRPTILLADEPTGNLDEASADIVMECLTQQLRSDSTPPTLIMVTHDPLLAASAEDVLVVRDRGVHAESRA